ncbi:hypothetical protein PVAP13_9KG327364 [Panicum virgatum]|uniref:Uncharacterized protein n=1 Tax=Panicum virgatum TaxID=38727 RepID=A0A8T0NKW4_PANVG|nr:hypothetical protein PVAP13_9KG327364 [Panicum virgatum]
MARCQVRILKYASMVGAYEILRAAQNMLKLTHIFSICFMYCVRNSFQPRSNAHPSPANQMQHGNKGTQCVMHIRC